MATEFREFQKIPRLMRRVVVTEKIDGTNGCIYVGQDGEFLVGSRTRWITPESDNHGFARWSHEHKEQLMQLGPGTHFGEWWGNGIQRGYGLPNGDKRFSLFNVGRWRLNGEAPGFNDTRLELPPGVGLVPILWVGPFGEFFGYALEMLEERLRTSGSHAAPGFMKPEGMVIYHEAGRCLFKRTLEKDDERKSVGTQQKETV